MYGRASVVRNIDFVGTGMIYNIASMTENFSQLPSLIPPNELGRFVDRDFDTVYAEYIMNNDNVFVEFFQIIYQLYLGNDVFLVFDDSADWAENIIESLLKLIQQRYGCNAVYINDEEDYLYARNNAVSKFAPGYGLYNLDTDKERFSYLIEVMNMKGIQIPKSICWGNQ